MPSVKSVSPTSVLARFVASYAPGRFAADMLAPAVLIDSDTVLVPRADRGDYADSEDYKVAPGALPNRVDSKFDTITVSQESYAATAVLPQEVLDANQLAIDLVASQLGKARTKLLGDREARLASILDASSSYASGHTTTLTNKWSDTTNGTPLDDIYSALEQMPEPLPGTKTVLAVTPEALHALLKHPQLRGGGASRPVVSKAEALSLFDGELDDIVVLAARRRTSKRGAANSFARIFDKTKARILRVPSSPNAREMQAFALTFRRNLGPSGFHLEQWRDPAPGRAGSINVKVALAEAITSVQKDQGYLISNVV